MRLGIVLGLGIICLASSAAHARYDYALGVQMGVNFHSFATEPDLHADMKTGFIGGGQLEMRLGDWFFFQPELRFVQKGHTYTNGVVQTSSSVNYIEFPLLAKAKLWADEQFRPYFFTGPNFGVRVGDTSEVKVSGVVTPTTGVEFKTGDIAWDMGLGAELEVAPQAAVFLAFRFSMGLVDMTASQYTEWYTRGLQITTGVNFGF